MEIEKNPKEIVIEKNKKDTKDQKICLIILGMAGSGKTTFMK